MKYIYVFFNITMYTIMFNVEWTGTTGKNEIKKSYNITHVVDYQQLWVLYQYENSIKLHINKKNPNI